MLVFFVRYFRLYIATPYVKYIGLYVSEALARAYKLHVQYQKAGYATG